MDQLKGLMYVSGLLDFFLLLNVLQILFTCCRYFLGLELVRSSLFVQFPSILRTHWTPCWDMSRFQLIALWDLLCWWENSSYFALTLTFFIDSTKEMGTNSMFVWNGFFGKLSVRYTAFLWFIVSIKYKLTSGLVCSLQFLSHLTHNVISVK